MVFLYDLITRIYFLLIALASPFNRKAKQWIDARKKLFSSIQKNVGGKGEWIWIHCASLGEFEQGRPVIEGLKKKFPQYKILLTFFSPSGYSVRKDYPGADFVCYLPADSHRHAAKFIRIVQPRFAIFVKYEFWYHFMHELYKKQIPYFIVSARFRPGQLFFRWFGSLYLSMLKRATYIFVQNEDSKKLLYDSNVMQVSVTGDTRFDRVNEISKTPQTNSLTDLFCLNAVVILAGSTWAEDESIIFPLIEEYSASRPTVKWIIAPHEVHEHRIHSLEEKLEKITGASALRLSQAHEGNIGSVRVLLIDNIGMLSSLYKNARIAFMGGGFGKGIHNILEPAAFGVPVIFGPRYRKFSEAVDLVENEGAFSIKESVGLKNYIDMLIDQPLKYENASSICKRYVEKGAGATEKILDEIAKEMSPSTTLRTSNIPRPISDVQVK